MILNKVVYSDVTVFNLIVAFSMIIISIIFARVVSIYLRRFLKDKIAPEHTDLINKIAFPQRVVWSGNEEGKAEQPQAERPKDAEMS